MSMRPEATIWLDVVIVHYAHRAEIGITMIGPKNGLPSAMATGFSAKEKWKRDLSQFVETELSHFGLVVPSLGGLPNQLGSGSETNSLEAGMCTRGIEK